MDSTPPQGGATESTLEAGPQTRAASPWALLALLVAGHAVKHLYNSGFFVILPEIRSSLGLSNAAIGTLSTARTFAGSVGNLPAGFVTDRYGRHWARILALTMIGIGGLYFVMGTLDSYWPLVALAALIGATISFWHPPAIAALSQRFAQRRGFAIALHGTGGTLGETLGPIIVGALLLGVVWQVVLRASLLPAVATGLLVWLLMRHTQGPTQGTLSLAAYLRSLRRLVGNRALLTVLLVTGGYSAVQAGMATFLPIYLRIDLGYSALEMAAFLSVAQAAGLFSQPALGLLSDRFGRRVVLVPSLLCLGAGVLAVGLVPSGWPLVLTVAAMGAFQFPLMSVFLAAAMDIVGQDVQATTVSLVFGTGTVFGSLSPALLGILADAYGVRVVFIAAAAIAVLAAAFLWYRSEERAAGVHA